MIDIICPLCGKTNPPGREECLYCQAPLKAPGFLAPSEGESIIPSAAPPDKAEEGQVPTPDSTSSLEQAIPDWLKQTEASFLDQTEVEPEKLTPDEVSEQIDSLLNQPAASAAEEVPAIDDEWLASLLSEVGAGEPDAMTLQDESIGEPPAVQPETPAKPMEEAAEEEPSQPQKPGWLTDMEKASTIRLEGGVQAGEAGEKEAEAGETGEEKAPEQAIIPDWVGKPAEEAGPEEKTEPEAPITPAELPGWLEALRPSEAAAPTEPVEDLSAAEIVTAGPLVGLRGVISAHPSAIRGRKPPTYSIKLRVTDEQRARVEMMEQLLADEQKPKPMPSQTVITSRNIFRLVITIVLLLPIVWMIITRSQRAQAPQSGNIPGVVDFTRQIQLLPSGLPVLVAFDYEAGFSGEMDTAVTSVLTQLIAKNAYITMVATSPSGPALAESLIHRVVSSQPGSTGTYSNYADLGYIPRGTMGLKGLASSPKNVIRYSLESKNVWAVAPLNSISTIGDFKAVIVMTNDPDIARAWIEQVGPQLKEKEAPLLIVTSSQAEPLIRPYYEASPRQVQGLVAGLVGGIALARTFGIFQQNGMWDAFSIGITASVLIILVGSIVSVVLQMIASDKKKGG